MILIVKQFCLVKKWILMVKWANMLFWYFKKSKWWKQIELESRYTFFPESLPIRKIIGIQKWMLGNGPSVANQNKRVPNTLPGPSSSWWRDHQTFLQAQSLYRLVRCSKMYWSPRGSLQSMNQNIKIIYSNTLGLVIVVYISIFNINVFLLTSSSSGWGTFCQDSKMT